MFKVASFIQILRDELKINTDQSIFLFNKKNQVLKMDRGMEEIYQCDADDDGFLYLSYAEMKTMG